MVVAYRRAPHKARPLRQNRVSVFALLSLARIRSRVVGLCVCPNPTCAQGSDGDAATCAQTRAQSRARTRPWRRRSRRTRRPALLRRAVVLT